MTEFRLPLLRLRLVSLLAQQIFVLLQKDQLPQLHLTHRLNVTDCRLEVRDNILVMVRVFALNLPVLFDVLVGRRAIQYEPVVEHKQRNHEHRESERIDEEGNCQGICLDATVESTYCTKIRVQVQSLSHVYPNQLNHGNHRKEHERCHRNQVQIEEPVVSFSDAGPEPGAVMVKSLHAVVAHGAVGGSGWPVDPAGVAVLQFQEV